MYEVRFYKIKDSGIKKHPYRKKYLKIIDMIELYFK